MGQSLNLRVTPSLICKCLLTRHKAARLAPMLFQQGDARHGHAPVHGFAHVVNGQQGHLDSGQGVIQINNLAATGLKP